MESFSQTHYGKAMKIVKLHEWAAIMGETIVAEFFTDDGEHFGAKPVLIYSGMSGTAHATAVMLSIPRKWQGDVGMMYVRKENEKSHGCRVETSNMEDHNEGNIRLILVDDFVDEGHTLVHIVNMVSQKFKRRVNPDRLLMALSGDPYSNLRTFENSMIDQRCKLEETTFVRYHCRRNWLLWKREYNRLSRKYAKELTEIFA